MSTPPPKAAPATAHQLFETLSRLNIEYLNHSHAAVMTVEQSQALRGPIHGLHAKNLFLKDKKGGLWLVVAEEGQSIDLKDLRKRLGVANLSFAKAEILMDVLGVTPGTVTPFAVINDGGAQVRLVLDAKLANAPQTNFHPLDNAQTTTVSGAGLVKFLHSFDHAPLIINFTASEADTSD
ncbi:MAG: prolyl-tRNA synthetase associated domain-containing protein [Rhodospirillales bacterium]|nr:prolyl-tRNA synthetase associated domain-containing protein [Rhodospirillales bacterium]